MTKSKQGYSSFRLKELDGGINTKNSPNEIENKQAINSINFNFDGNKLVNSKGYKKYVEGQNITFNNSEIKGIDVIDGRLYITFLNNITNKIDIMQGTDGVWRNALDNLNSFFYYIPTVVGVGETYSITITGVDYSYGPVTFSYTTVLGDTAETIYSNISSQLNATPYIKETIGITTIQSGTTFTEYNGLFFWSFGKFRISATETGNGILLQSVQNNSGFHYQLFRSGDDLILINNSNSPIYYKSLADDNSPSATEAYFGQYINGLNTNIGTYYNGKFICAQENSNILLFSKTSSITEPYLVKDFGGYDGGFQRIGGDGIITGIITGENGIYVFKEDEIYYSNSIQDDGNSFSFVFNRITNNGAKDKYCITRVGQDIFYYDGINKKIRRLSYEQNLTTLRDTAVSNEIDELLKNQKSITGIQQKLYYSYPNVRFATQTSGNLTNYNDIIYTYNVDNKSWTIEDNKAVKFGYGKYFSKENVNGEIYEDDYSYETDGERKSKEFDMGDAIDYKRWSEIEIYGKNSSDITLYIDIYIDGVLKKTFTVTNNFGDYFRRKFDMWLEGRNIQIGIRYNGVGYLEINELNFQYKPLKGYNYN